MPLRLTPIAAATLLILAPAYAQEGAPASPETAVSPASNPPAPEKVVEGATADRVAQIEQCQGHKFDSMVQIDPVKRRSTRVKLCANPGSSDADWVKTLEAAAAQIEQRDMPASAKDKLLGELRSEIAKFAPAPKSVAITPAAPVFLSGDAASLTPPTERYETSILPPLTPKAAAKGSATVASAPQRPMRIRIKCLERGQTGPGGTCDFFVADTVLAVSAVEGLEEGGTLRFRRKGEERGEVRLTALQAGQSARVRLPTELCKGVSSSKVEIELLAPKSTGAVAARLGPFGLRC